MSRRGTRWSVGLLATLALTAFGLLYAHPTLLTAALIPLAYVVYGTLSRVPPDAGVAVSRSIAPTSPEPGEAVQVALTVRNESEVVLPDVRVVDGVPDELAVTDGPARLCSPLSPGETASVTYTVVAKRGEFAFDEPAVRLRSLAGDEQATVAVAVDGDDQFACTTTAGQPPLQHSTTNRQGRLPVDSGGAGLEFFATRQYKRGDPVNRIDWHHVAKTGEFVTVQYRTEQAVETVLVVDARRVSRVTAAAGYPTGAQLSAYAGERLFDALEAAGVATSATALGFEAGDLDGLVGPDGLPWIDPHHDTSTRGTAALLFHRLQTATRDEVDPLSLEPPAALLSHGPVAATDRTERTQTGSRGSRDHAWNGERGRTARADGGAGGASDALSGDDELDEAVDRLLSRLPDDSQVLLCSPLLDNWPVRLAGTLAMQDYPLVVVSPDVTAAGTPGQRLGAVSRRFRLQALERTGAATVDWSIDRPFDEALRLSLPHLLSSSGPQTGGGTVTDNGRNR
jgi:uncharacterized protein (DUF58 family)